MEFADNLLKNRGDASKEIVESEVGCLFRLRLNVALTHPNRSYRDSETKGNVAIGE